MLEAKKLENMPKYLLVEAKALPDIFLKVVAAKKLLSQGKVKNASEASKAAGISRSAFYKYKDSVYLYDGEITDSIVTFYATLTDKPGILSLFVGKLSELRANILTVNQNIPIDGAASVTVSARIDETGYTEQEITDMLSMIDGVVGVKTVSAR